MPVITASPRFERVFVLPQASFRTVPAMSGAKLLRNVGRVTLTGGKNLIPVPWKTGTRSTQPGILGRAAARFNVTSLPIIPSGTAGTVPDQDAVWAGIFGQAATSAVYSFSDSTFAPFALVDYQHGVSTLTSQILYGCTPEDVTVRFNTDYLSMDMSGSGIYLLDSDNFANEDTTGKGGLSSFPTEPSSPTTTGSIIVGFTGTATFDSNVMSAATALIRGWTLRIRTGSRVIADGFGDAYGQLQVGGAREVSMGFDFVDSDENAAEHHRGNRHRSRLHRDLHGEAIPACLSRIHGSKRLRADRIRGEPGTRHGCRKHRRSDGRVHLEQSSKSDLYRERSRCLSRGRSTAPHIDYMEFSPTITVESQKFPGVKFTVHRMGISRRTEIEFKTADMRAKQREIQQALGPLFKADEAEDEKIRAIIERAEAAPAPESAAILDEIKPIEEALAAKTHSLERNRLEEQSRIAQRQIEPVWVKAGLVSLDGITVAGQAMTADQLCDFGPRELFAEIYQAVFNEAYLSQAELKNLPSRIISGQRDLTENATTIVQSAEAQPVDGTPSATVVNFSQAA